MQHLRIGYLSTIYHTAHLLKGQGLIESELGLQGLWRLFGTGPAMLDAFSAGEIDIGYIGLPPAMIGIGRGLPLTCIAGGHCEGTVMAGNPQLRSLDETGSVARVLQQFSGIRIGTPSQGSIHDIIIRHLLREHRLSDELVLNYPWADLIPDAVTRGEIAAAVGTPPLAVLCEQMYGLKTLLPAAALWPFNPSYGIVVHNRLKEDTALLEAFVRLHEQACNMIRLKPQRAAAVVAGEVKVVDAAFVRRVFAVSPRYCAALPQDYVDATMAFVPVLQQMGHLTTDLQQEQLFDRSLVERIHPEQHHYSDPACACTPR